MDNTHRSRFQNFVSKSIVIIVFALFLVNISFAADADFTNYAQNNTLSLNSSFSATCTIEAGKKLQNVHLYLQENSTGYWNLVNSSSIISGNPASYCGTVEKDETCSATWSLSTSKIGQTWIRCTYNRTQGQNTPTESSQTSLIIVKGGTLALNLSGQTDMGVGETKNITAALQCNDFNCGTVSIQFSTPAFENLTPMAHQCSLNVNESCTKVVAVRSNYAATSTVTAIAESGIDSVEKSLSIQAKIGSISVSLLSGSATILENGSYTLQTTIECKDYNCLRIEATPQVNGSFITANSDLSAAVPKQACTLDANETCTISWSILAGKAGNYGILVRANNSQYIYATSAVAVRAELPYTTVALTATPQTIQKTLAFNITCSAATNTNAFLNLKLETKKITDEAFENYSLSSAFLCSGNCSSSGYSSTSFSKFVTGVQSGNYTLRCVNKQIDAFGISAISNEVNVSITSGYLQLSSNNISGNKTEQKQINASVYCLGGYCGNVNINITYNNIPLSSETPIKLISGASNRSCGILFSDNTCNLSSLIEIDFGNKTGSSESFLITALSDSADTNNTSSVYHATGYTGKLSIRLTHATNLNQSENTTAFVNVSCESYCGNVSVSLNLSANETFACGFLQDNSCTSNKIVSYSSAGKIKVSATAYSLFDSVEAELEINITSSSSNQSTVSLNNASASNTNSLITNNTNTTASTSTQSLQNTTTAETNQTMASTSAIDQAALDESSPEELMQEARQELSEELEQQEKEIVVRDLKDTKSTLEDLLKSGSYPSGSARIISDSIITLASTLGSLERNEISAKDARAKINEVKTVLNQVTGKAAAAQPESPATAEKNNNFLMIVPIIVITFTAIAIKRKRNKMFSERRKASMRTTQEERVEKQEHDDSKEADEVQMPESSAEKNMPEMTFSYTTSKESETFIQAVKMPEKNKEPTPANDAKRPSTQASTHMKRIRNAKIVSIDYLQKHSIKKQILKLRKELDSNFKAFKAGKIDQTDYESNRQKFSWEINKLRMQLEEGMKNAN